MSLFRIPKVGSFANATAESLEHALEESMSHAAQWIEQRLNQNIPATWDNLIHELTMVTDQLSKTWGVVSHLHSVLGHEHIRQLYNTWLPKISEFWSHLSQNTALYQAYCAIEQSSEYAQLSQEQQASLQKSLRDFRLSGVALPDHDKKLFVALSMKLSELSATFEQNVLDATDSFSYTANPQELEGVPEGILSSFQKNNDGQYVLNVRMPCYMPIMQYAHSSSLREALYHAYVTRASELGSRPELDNTSIIQERLQQCLEQAKLLGFSSFADYSLANKMADTPQAVLEFLHDLAQKARPSAEQDLQDLKAFAGKEQLNSWDVAYYSEQLRQERYGFSEYEVRQYFPLDKVLDGLFGLIRTLYGIHLKETPTDVWHPDVRYFEIFSPQNQLMGGVYLDLFAREGKRGGAWMDDAQGRWHHHNHMQQPVAYLVCNFTAPHASSPCTLTHDEVTTLFHEFGHGLHHLLTQVDVADIAGIHGVEWDAVELPSQFMENFCWEWPVVESMSCHIEHGSPLPKSLFAQMLAAKNFQSGLQTMRQIEFAMFDMKLYMANPAISDYQNLLEEIRQETSVLSPPPYNRFANSFSHIFAGGYAAGYYSYKWAEVLSCDAYAAFEEEGGANSSLGQKFWQEILAVGGSRPAKESFIAFRGREPSIDALLRLSGLMPQHTAQTV